MAISEKELMSIRLLNITNTARRLGLKVLVAPDDVVIIGIKEINKDAIFKPSGDKKDGDGSDHMVKTPTSDSSAPVLETPGGKHILSPGRCLKCEIRSPEACTQCIFGPIAPALENAGGQKNIGAICVRCGHPRYHHTHNDHLFSSPRDDGTWCGFIECECKEFQEPPDGESVLCKFCKVTFKNLQAWSDHTAECNRKFVNPMIEANRNRLCQRKNPIDKKICGEPEDSPVHDRDKVGTHDYDPRVDLSRCTYTSKGFETPAGEVEWRTCVLQCGSQCCQKVQPCGQLRAEAKEKVLKAYKEGRTDGAKAEHTAVEKIVSDLQAKLAAAEHDVRQRGLAVVLAQERIASLEARLKIPEPNPFPQGYDAIDLMNERERQYKAEARHLTDELATAEKALVITAGYVRDDANHITALKEALNKHHAIMQTHAGHWECVLCGCPYFKSPGDRKGGDEPTDIYRGASPAPETPGGKIISQYNPAPRKCTDCETGECNNKECYHYKRSGR